MVSEIAEAIFYLFLDVGITVANAGILVLSTLCLLKNWLWKTEATMGTRPFDAGTSSPAGSWGPPHLDFP
jgi:hypothetical protein